MKVCKICEHGGFSLSQSHMCLLKITYLHNKAAVVTKMLVKSICLGVYDSGSIVSLTAAL